MSPVVRDEPFPVEFHNTIYAESGRIADALADGAGLAAWLRAERSRLPAAAKAVDVGRLPEFRRLREAVREALAAAADGRRVPATTVEALNETAARDPQSLELSRSGAAVSRHHAADATDMVLAAIAAETIALVGGPEAAHLHACGAPGCVLMFARSDARSAWCSPACGNRARQARHYARTRAAATRRAARRR